MLPTLTRGFSINGYSIFLFFLQWNKLSSSYLMKLHCINLSGYGVSTLWTNLFRTQTGVENSHFFTFASFFVPCLRSWFFSLCNSCHWFPLWYLGSSSFSFIAWGHCEYTQSTSLHSLWLCCAKNWFWFHAFCKIHFRVKLIERELNHKFESWNDFWRQKLQNLIQVRIHSTGKISSNWKLPNIPKSISSFQNHFWLSRK